MRIKPVQKNKQQRLLEKRFQADTVAVHLSERALVLAKAETLRARKQLDDTKNELIKAYNADSAR